MLHSGVAPDLTQKHVISLERIARENTLAYYKNA